jgi:hypothetical protein
MTNTTPNRPPLWEVLRNARFDVYRKAIGQPTEEEYAAAQIRALRDWLVPEGLLTADEADIRDQLTAEADRAERGDA